MMTNSEQVSADIYFANKVESPPLPSWSEISLARAYLKEFDEPPVLEPEVVIRGLLNKISQLENQARRDDRLLSLLERENEKLSFEAYND